MTRLPRTLSYAAILLTATIAVRFWCKLVAFRFRSEHPDGMGPLIAHFFWDYSWVGIVVASILASALMLFHVRKWDGWYEVTYFFGLWLVVFWFVTALLGMEVAFVPWYDLRGAHY